MTKGTLNHFELHVSKPDESLAFYKDLLSYFEWTISAEWPGGLGMSDGSVSMWFFATPEEKRGHTFDRDATGIGHVGIHVADRAAVEGFVNDYLKPHGIEPQFDTPRARTDFNPTYYQVMFLDPEGLAIEVFSS